MHFRRYASGGNISALIEPSKGVLRICTDAAPAEPLADGRRRLAFVVARPRKCGEGTAEDYSRNSDAEV